MLSRTANSIYWMTRYIERAENVARFIDVNLLLMLDLPHVTTQHWDSLVMTTGDVQLFREHYPQVDQDNVIRFLTFDRDNPNSIFTTVRAARENARSVREIISSEMWEQINTFYLMLKEAQVSQVLHSPSAFFSNVKQACHMFDGVIHGTLSHGEAWNFAQMGRFLERADKTARILDVEHFLPANPSDTGTHFEIIQWSAVLKSVSAFEMYRQRYRGIQLEKLIGFLLLNPDFPRSLYHCVVQAEASLYEVSGTVPGKRFSNAAEQSLGKLRAKLEFCDLDEILEKDLHEFLDSIELHLNQIDDKIYDTFFAKRPIESNFQTQSQSR